ncbi:MAG: hypothetical protein KIT09_06955 [Bryobacteraceae bacterium]|nr:hypothetical protein [Bryobacteraceae bacterium]
MESLVPKSLATPFHQLGQADFAEIVQLRDHVLASLPHPDCYVSGPDEDAVIQAHLGQAGVTFGARIGSRLIAYAALSLDIDDAHLDPEFHHAIVARSVNGDLARDRCAVLAVAMVHADFRGRHLHREAIRRRLQFARANGRSDIVAMVSPHNAPCLHNLVAEGFRVQDVIGFPDGRERYFLRGNPA